MRYMSRIHLAIAVDLDHDFHSIPKRRGDAFHDSTTDALIDLIKDHANTGVSIPLQYKLSGIFWAFVIHNIDNLSTPAHLAQHLQNGVAHAIAGDNYRYPRRAVHVF